VSFPTDSVTDRMEESRGGLVVEGEAVVVVAVVVGAAMVVTEGAATQAVVVKAKPTSTDKRITPDRRQRRVFLGNIVTSPVEDRAP
jgi:hypothetical protein